MDRRAPITEYWFSLAKTTDVLILSFHICKVGITLVPDCCVE